MSKTVEHKIWVHKKAITNPNCQQMLIGLTGQGTNFCKATLLIEVPDKIDYAKEFTKKSLKHKMLLSLTGPTKDNGLGREIMVDKIVEKIFED